jgi:hypothetical protein
MAHCFRFSLLVSLSTRAGRKYHPVLEQLLLFQLPLEFTFRAFVAPLLELQ